ANIRSLLMIRTLLLTVGLLCCSMWAIAQTSQDNTSNRPPEMNPSSRQMMIEGCLANSGDNYTLTDSAGTKYRLTGNMSSLSAHANQQVKVTGTGQGTGTQGTGTATTTESTETFHVAKVTKLANSCSDKKSK
ncbi:MAG TPA: hypothetical protein VLK33_09480, partial [Terriglobales bacterium]|nr:hypothetical protein [Terriglobales bacterium]